MQSEKIKIQSITVKTGISNIVKLLFSECVAIFKDLTNVINYTIMRK